MEDILYNLIIPMVMVLLGYLVMYFYSKSYTRFRKNLIDNGVPEEAVKLLEHTVVEVAKGKVDEKTLNDIVTNYNMQHIITPERLNQWISFFKKGINLYRK